MDIDYKNRLIMEILLQPRTILYPSFDSGHFRNVPITKERLMHFSDAFLIQFHKQVMNDERILR